MHIVSFGDWSNNPTSYLQQWQSAPAGPSAPAANSSSWTNIAGATSTTYTPPSGDDGKWFRAVIRGVNSAGPAVTPYYSAAVKFVVTTTPSVPAVPVIAPSQAYTVSEGASIGATVGTVQATNSPTAFAIVGGNSAARFSISSSGVITLAGLLDYETATSYALSVKASNGGGDGAPVTVTVNVGDVVETPPAPTIPTYPLESLAGAQVLYSSTKMTSTASAPFITASGGVVSVWPDQMGQAVNADTTWDNSGSPALVSSIPALGGIPGVRFDGTSYLSTGGGTVSNANGDLLIALNIVRRAPTNGWEVLAGVIKNGEENPYNGGVAVIMRGNQISLRAYGNTDTETTPLTLNEGQAATVAAVIRSAGTAQLIVNDTASDTINIASGYGMGGLFRVGGTVAIYGPYGGGQDRASADVSQVYFGTNPDDQALVRAVLAREAGLTVAGGAQAAWDASPHSGSGGGGGTPPYTPPNEAALAAFTRTYDPSLFAKRTINTSQTAGVVYAPIVPQASNANDLVGGMFTTPPGVAVSARYQRRLQTFLPGQLMPGQNVTCVWDNIEHECEVIPRTLTPEDGSIETGLVVTKGPALTAGATKPYMLRKTSTALSGNNVDLAAVMGACNVTGTITVLTQNSYQDGEVLQVNQPYTLVPSGLLGADTLNDVRYTGKLSTERRVRVDMGRALRGTYDFVAYKDGTCELDAEWAADTFTRDVGNTRGYVVNIDWKHNGVSVVSKTGLKLFNRTAWGHWFHTANTPAQSATKDAPEYNDIRDIGHDQKAGFTPFYEIKDGVKETTLAYYNTTYDNFRGPYDTCYIQSPNMGGTGGRTDIGPITGPHAAFLVTQDWRMRRMVFGQAEAFRGLPTNGYDPARRCTINHFDYYRFQYSGADTTGGNCPETFELGRDWDEAHQPLCAYMAYLLTGRRSYEELVERQGILAFTFIWDLKRTYTVGGLEKDWVIYQNLQPREAGWGMRDAAMACQILPDSNRFKALLLKAINFNYAYLNSQTAYWDQNAGEFSGFVWYDHPDSHGEWKWWMQDIAAYGTACAVKAGSGEALKFLRYQAKLLKARGQQDPAVWTYPDSCTNGCHVSYMGAHDPTQLNIKTFADMATLGTPDTPDNGASFTPGTFAVHWRNSLVHYVTLTNDAEARTVLNNLQAMENVKDSGLRVIDQQADPQYYMTEPPRVA